MKALLDAGYVRSQLPGAWIVPGSGELVPEAVAILDLRNDTSVYEPPWCGLCYAPAPRCACPWLVNGRAYCAHLLRDNRRPGPDVVCRCGNTHPWTEPRYGKDNNALGGGP